MHAAIDYIPKTATDVFILTNPSAGSGAKEHVIHELQQLLQSDGWHVETTSDLLRVAQCANSGSENPLRAVVAAGGDGTVSAVVNATSAQTPIAVLPLGTENLLAKYLHMSVTPQELCHAITHGATVRLDAGLAGDRIFLLMAGCGFDADVVQRLHAARKGHIRHLSYVKPILDSIRRYKYPELHVSCEALSASGPAPHPASAETAIKGESLFQRAVVVRREHSPLRGWTAVCSDGGGNRWTAGRLWLSQRIIAARAEVFGRSRQWPASSLAGLLPCADASDSH